MLFVSFKRLPLCPSQKWLQRGHGVSLPAGTHQYKASRGEQTHGTHLHITSTGIYVCHHMTVVAQMAEEELYSSSSQLKKKQSEVSSEPFLYDTHSNLQRSTVPRQHNHLMREYSTSTGQTPLW